MLRLHLHLLSDSTGETLENIAKAALSQYDDVETVRHFWPMVRTEAHLDRILQEIERPLLQVALDATGGNQLRCADLLGINRNTLRKKLTELNIEVTRRRKLM